MKRLVIFFLLATATPVFASKTLYFYSDPNDGGISVSIKQKLDAAGIAYTELRLDRDFRKHSGVTIFGKGSVVVDVDGSVWREFIPVSSREITDAWAAAPSALTPPVSLPSLEVKPYLFGDAMKTPKTTFDVGQTLAIDFRVLNAAGNVVNGFSQTVNLPVFKYDPITNAFTGTARRLKVVFANGLATKSIGPLSASGDFGFDQRVTALATVPTIIIQVVE